MANFFKITLDLNKKVTGDREQKDNFVNDLLRAKDKFNSSKDKEKYLLVLSTTGESLEILLKYPEAEIKEDDISPVGSFLEVLAGDFGWGGEMEGEKDIKEIFSLKAVKKVDGRECEEAIKELKENNPQLYDSGDAREFKREEKPKNRRRRISMFEELGSGEQSPDFSLEEAIEKMNKLVGFCEFKKEMEIIIQKEKAIRTLKAKDIKANILPQFYIFTYKNEGFGYSTALSLLSSIFFHLGLIDSPNYIEIEPRDFHRMDLLIEEYGVFILKEKSNYRSRLLADDLELPSADLANVVYIFVEEEGSENLEGIKRTLEKKGNYFRTVHFPDFGLEELVKIQGKILADAGMVLDEKAKEMLREIIKREKEGENFNNLRTLKKIASELFFMGDSTQFSPDQSAPVVTPEICGKLLEKYPEKKEKIKQESAWEKLQGMVGLKDVKRTVEEILAYVIMGKRRKEMGLATSEMCMHMEFSGSPGTGKTTVARIIGEILKEEGVLDEGYLIEASRSDLIGAYVGHTAIKTSSLIRKSRGNVLFIDEAYSLDGKTNQDYGPEAISTLTKYMEDYRDDLVVILAGYPEEMEKLMGVNPGLKERIAHRIYFPDYSGEELFAIFQNNLGQNFEVEEKAKNLLFQFFHAAKANAGRDFGNGRLVRNVIERLKLKQSQRLFQEGERNPKALRLIKVEDVEKALEDRDIKKSLQGKARKPIGF